MISSVFACLIVVASAASSTQPTSALSTTSRVGRQAEVRFVNRLSSAGTPSNFFVQGVPYNGQDITATYKIGSNPTNIRTFSVASGSPNTFSAYETIDTGNTGNSATFVFTLNTSPNTKTVSCSSNNVQQNERVTFVFTQTVTAPSFVTSSCTGGLTGTCTGALSTPGTVNVVCTAIKESLPTRSCSQLPVRFYSDNDGCPVLLELAAEESGSGATKRETFLTEVTVPTTFGSDTLTLERAVAYEITDVSLFTPRSDARSIDIYISSAGVPSTLSTFTTAFLNVANVAFRTTSGVRDNTFDIVISQSSDITQKDKVVHFQENIAPGDKLGWIEVPAGFTYTLFVYDDGVSQTDIFGNNGASTPTASTNPTPIATGTLSASLDTNNLRIFRIANTPGTNTVIVNDVPLSTSTTLVPEDNTKFILWNNIVNSVSTTTNIQLANPSGDCCNFLQEQDGDTIFKNSFSVAEENVLTPAPRTTSETFDVYPASASCPNIGNELVAADVDLTSVASSGECAIDGIIIHGRVGQVSTTVCSGSSPSGMTCTAATQSTVNSEVIVSLASAVGSTSASGDIDLHFPVSLCDCQAPAAPCTPALTCEEQEQVDILSAAILANTATVTAAISTSTTSINANIDSDTATINTNLRNVNSTQNDNADELTARVASVQSSVNTVNTATTAIRSDVAVVRAAVNKLKKDIKKVGKDVKDLN